jgi:Mg2+-importing ATPase
MVERPRRWDIAFIGKFMVVFGILSSVFDFLTFGMLREVFRAGPDVFRTGWFIESLLTELLVALVVRTSRPFYRSRPGRVLLWSTTILVIFTFMIPYIPGAGLFGFVPLEPWLLLAIAGVAVLYVGATELAKRRFYGITEAVRGQTESAHLQNQHT